MEASLPWAGGAKPAVKKRSDEGTGNVLEGGQQKRRNLKVVLRVPVGVKNDDSVRRGQVDPDPARLGADEEGEAVVPRFVEAVDGALQTQ